jgi:hypothetical protein
MTHCSSYSDFVELPVFPWLRDTASRSRRPLRLGSARLNVGPEHVGPKHCSHRNGALAHTRLSATLADAAEREAELERTVAALRDEVHKLRATSRYGGGATSASAHDLRELGALRDENALLREHCAQLSDELARQAATAARASTRVSAFLDDFVGPHAHRRAERVA